MEMKKLDRHIRAIFCLSFYSFFYQAREFKSTIRMTKDDKTELWEGRITRIKRKAKTVKEVRVCGMMVFLSG